MITFWHSRDNHHWENAEFGLLASVAMTIVLPTGSVREMQSVLRIGLDLFSGINPLGEGCRDKLVTKPPPQAFAGRIGQACGLLPWKNL